MLPTLALIAALGACPNAAVTPTAQNLPAVRSALVCLHNQVRAAHHRGPLAPNPHLQAAASAHARTMVAAGIDGHTDPNGPSFTARILRTGYLGDHAHGIVGENLAAGADDMTTPAELMQAWMSSPGHRANILTPSFQDIGIGIRLGTPDDPTAGVTITVDYGGRR